MGRRRSNVQTSVAADAPLAHTELPEGWALSTLAEVCHVNPPKPRRDQVEPTTEVTFVPMPAVDANSGTIAAPQIRQFSAVRSGFTAFRDDDVIMAKITPCMENGKAAVARGLRHGLGFGSTEFHVLRSRGAVLPDYVYHFIRQPSFRSAAEMEMTGSVGQKRVPTSFIGSAELPVPPLAEQKRIVDRIETLLKSVDAARERLAIVPDILKRFRQSILAAACSGRLTEDWRDTTSQLESSVAILRRVRDSHAAKHREPLRRRDRPFWSEWSADPLDGPFDLPDGWEWVCAGAAYAEAGYGTSMKSERDREDGVPVLGVPHIASGRLEPEGAKRSALPPGEIERLRLRSGDIIICRTNGSLALIGKAAIIPDLSEPHAFASYLIRVRTLTDALLPEYLHAMLSGPVGRKQIEDMARSTAGQFNLSLGILGGLMTPLPPMSEQIEIIKRVGSLMNLVDAIDNRVAATAVRADRLTQAILTKAFNGELVAAEAELARTDGRDYESAEALLTRIRAESAGPHIPPARRPRISAKPIITATAAAPASAPSPKRAHSSTIFYRRAAIAAYIIDRLHTRPTFGRVQLEKCLYLAETYAGVDLEGDFKRAAAGPLDAEYLYKLESAAHKNGWFVKRTIDGDKTRHTYHPGAKSAQLLAAAEKYLGAGKAKMDFLLGWMEKFDTERAEIVATLFAAWSDLLRAGNPATDDAIITEVRENWHESKKRFEPARLRIALGWMREHALVPPGTGPTPLRDEQ